MAPNRDKILRDAEKLVHKGKVEQAIREYEKLLKLNPGDANTINRVGDLYGRIGQVDKAIELYEKIADSFTRDGFTTKAIAILKKINRLVPQRLDIFDRLAELYIQQGLLVEAKSQYQMLADWYSKNGENEQAIEVHQKLVQLDPNNHMAHLRLADLLMQSDQPDEAVEAYGRLGTMLLQRGKLDEAERLYRHALEQNPPTGEFLQPLCAALIEAGRMPAAQEFLSAAMERSPGSSSLLVLEVRVELGLGQADEALEKARALLQANPHDRDVRCLVGKVFLSAGESVQARDLLVPAIEDHLNRTEYQEAQQLLQGLLKAMPQDPSVLTAALRAFEPSGDSEMLFTLKAALADVHFKTGQLEAAGRLYVDLIRIEPENTLFRRRLTQVEDRGAEATASPAGAALDEDEMPEPEIIEFDAADQVELEPLEAAPGVQVSPVADIASQFDPLERLAEANVFAKYGLVDKAIHHLEEIVRSFPDHVEAREKLVLLYVEQRRHEDAREVAEPLLEHYRRTDNASALKLLEESLPRPAVAAPEPPSEAVEFVTDGITEEDEQLLVLDLDEAVADELTFEVQDEMAAASPVSGASEELAGADEDFSLVVDASNLIPEDDELQLIEFDVESAGADPSEIETLSDAWPEPAVSAFDEMEGELPFVDEQQSEELVPSSEPPAVGESDVEVLELEEIDVIEPETLIADEELEEIDAYSLEPEAPDEVATGDTPAASPVEPAPPVAPVLLELDELERSILGSRPSRPRPRPDDLLASARQAAEVLFRKPEPAPAEGPEVDLDSSPFEAPEAADSPPEQLVELSSSFTGPSLSDLEQVDFFVQQELYDDAIRLVDRLEEEFPGDKEVAERRLALKSKGVLLEDVAVGGESPEELFADEEEYIDLAKELEEELAEEEAMVEEATGRGRDEALLEEVFREFQKGVSEQLSEEDSDTHFNLGIAYKEMGLLPEAIREFQVAARASEFFIECCSMIGVCYVEQGMHDQAAEWYIKALQAPDVGDDARLALRYDLASALEMAGEVDQAHQLWDEIAAHDPTYRDVVSRRGALS